MPFDPTPTTPLPDVAHEYQQVLVERLILAFVAGHRDLLLHAPCGSGKTLSVEVLLALFSGEKVRRSGFRGFHTSIILTPTRLIRNQWKPRGRFRRLKLRPSQGLLLYACKDLTEEQHVEEAAAEFWARFFRRDFESLPLIFTSTRQRLTTRAALEAIEVLPPDALKGFLFVLDETHHHATAKDGAGGNRSGELVELILARGGAVLGSSATPFSGSGEVIREGTHVIDLPLSVYHAQINPKTGKPFCPRNWEFIPVKVGFKTGDATLAIDNPCKSAEVELDEAVPAEIGAFALAAAKLHVDHWVGEGCPPHPVMRLRTVAAAKVAHGRLTKGKSGQAVRRALGRTPRVLRLYGELSAEELAAAHARLESGEWDVVIGVSRVDEGLDSRHASNVYTTGIPGSLAWLIQLINRASRDKWGFVGYPEEWCDRMRLTMFIPDLDDEAMEVLLKEYMNIPLAAALIVQNLRAGLEVIETNVSYRTPKRRDGGELIGAELEEAVHDAEHRQTWNGDLVRNSEAFASMIKRLDRRGPELTIAEAMQELEVASKGKSTEEREEMRSGLREHLIANHPDLAKFWRAAEKDSRTKGGKRGYRAPHLIRRDLEETWQKFLEECGHLIYPHGDVREAAATICGTVCETVDRVWGGLRQDPETRALELAAWRDAHGRSPKRGAEDPDEDRRANQLSYLRIHHPNLCLQHGLNNPDWGTQSERNAQEIRAWFDRTSLWPCKTAEDPDERRLGRALTRLRRRHLDLCRKYGIPEKADLSAAVRRGRGKVQYPNVLALAPEVMANMEATQRTPGPWLGFNRALTAAADPDRRGQSRGLGGTPEALALLCQVNSLARLQQEIRADCYRVTLKGAKRPDPRPWAELLAAGDNVRVEKAERGAYLDWSGGGGAPVRRKWRPGK